MGSALKGKNLLIEEQILSFKSGPHLKELRPPEKQVVYRSPSKLMENTEVIQPVLHYLGRGVY